MEQAHVSQHQDAVQLRAAGDRSRDSRFGAAVRAQAQRLQQAVQSERRGVQPSGRRGDVRGLEAHLLARDYGRAAQSRDRGREGEGARQSALRLTTRCPMRSRRHVCWVLLATLAPLGTALSQGAPASAPGYDVERSQSVQNAPAGSVGRKTTDREHRVGNADDSLGNEYNYVLTFGGFARRCPTSAGLVKGDFEYSIAYDATETGDDGEIRREHHVRRVVVQLEGQVGPNARLMYVDMTGDFTIERSGTVVPPTSERRSIQRRFTPGPGGEPDMPAMSAAVEMTADIAVASVILAAGVLYRAAELEWTKLNECVEFSFDPPTDTEQLGPNQARQVRVDFKSKEDGAAVPWMSDRIGAIRAIGTVEPRQVENADGAPVTLTYTASARPRRGHGIDVATESQAGVGNGLWRIVDRYEGTFTQVDKTEGSLSILTGT